MESYRSEDEQLEALKKWWRENGQATVIGIVLALSAVFGWRAWQDHRVEKAEAASAMYQNLLEADRLAAQNNAQPSTARHLADTLKQDYAGLTYALYGAMYKAKYAAQDQDWPAAEQELRWVLEQKPEQALALQAKVRLAQVLLAQKRYEDAQAVLSGTEMGAYAALIAETRGDIFLAQGQREQALTAYLEARQQLNAMESAPANAMLEMKIRDLQPAATGAAAVSETAPAASETTPAAAGSEAAQ